MSNRAVYLLLWNVRLGYEHAGLDFWLSSITVQAPKAPIFIVGSHVDQVSHEFPNIQALFTNDPIMIKSHIAIPNNSFK